MQNPPASPAGDPAAATAGADADRLCVFVHMACNVLLAQTILRVRARKKRRFWPMAAALLLFIGNWLCGAAALSAAPAGETITVAAVQPGIASHEGRKPEAYANALTLSAEAAAKQPALIILPESTTYSTFYYEPAEREPWAELAQESGGALLIGGPLATVRDRISGELLSPLAVGSDRLRERLSDGSKRYARYTRAAAYLLEAGGAEPGLYVKNREIPFFENGDSGEPFRLLPGKGSHLLVSGAYTTGVLLCYESMFSGMARQAAREGAQLLAVPTNDSWFSGGAAKRLHMAHSVFRAVETGLPLVQAGLDGYTAAVSARGELLAELPPGAPGLLLAAIPLEARQTPYRLWGDAWLLPCMAALGLLSIIDKKNRSNRVAQKEDKP